MNKICQTELRYLITFNNKENELAANAAKFKAPNKLYMCVCMCYED